MKKLRNLILSAFLVTAMSTTSTVQAQDDSCYAPAYCDSCDTSYWAAAIPIAVLVIAGIIIASTGRNHHSSSSSSRSSSSSSSHSHFSSCSCYSGSR